MGTGDVNLVHSFVEGMNGACVAKITRGGKEDPCTMRRESSVHGVSPEGIMHSFAGLSSPSPPAATESSRVHTHFGSLDLDDPPTTLQGALVYFDQCFELMNVKNADYGDAWRAQGYMGNLARIMSKTARLQALLWNDLSYSPASNETIEDTLKDLANLTYFMKRNFEEGNRWGN